MVRVEGSTSVAASGYELPLMMEAGDGVELALSLPNDGSAIYSLVDANRDFLVKTIPDFAHFTSKDAQQTYYVDYPVRMARGSLAPYTVVKDGQLVGEATLHLRRGIAAEMGCWLAEDAQGQGTMTRAAKRLAEFGFREWGLQVIYLHIDSHNTASQAVAQRLGAKKNNFLRAVARTAKIERQIWSLHA